MILKKAEYSVKPGKVDEVKQAIMQFVFHIKEDEPAVMFYEAFHVSGSNDFIHFMSFMDESAEKAHQNAGHTKAFVDKLHPLCTKKPVFKDLDLIAANKARLQ
jgi:quinol monooxygenase YgiN